MAPKLQQSPILFCCSDAETNTTIDHAPPKVTKKIQCSLTKPRTISVIYCRHCLDNDGDKRSIDRSFGCFIPQHEACHDREGSSEFLKENPRFLRNFLSEIPSIRARDLWHDAQLVYSFFVSVFAHASPELISKQVHKQDFQDLAWHLREVLSLAEGSDEWLETPMDEQASPDTLLLAACVGACRSSSELRDSMFRVVPESNESAVGALVRLLAAHKESSLLPWRLALPLFELVHTVLYFAAQTGGSYGFFHHLSQVESCGALAQVFRIMVLPLGGDEVSSNKVEETNQLIKRFAPIIIREIWRTSVIVIEKLHPESHTGRVLKDLVENHASSDTTDEILAGLKMLQGTAELPFYSTMATGNVRK